MEWERFSNDQVEQVLSHLFSGMSVFCAEVCEWLIQADLSQQFLADGAGDLRQWVSARFGLRHSTAAQLVRVARRLRDLPRLREMFGAGELSLDQADAISKLATAETEEALIAECLGMSNTALIGLLAERIRRRRGMSLTRGGNGGSIQPWTGFVGPSKC